MRGQSSIEYVLSLAVIMLGVVALLTAPQLVESFGVIYRTVLQRVGADAVLPAEGL